MSKIRVSETGEVDIKSIEGLSYDELKEWIGLRLHGKDTQIPIDFRQGDTPYYIITLLYPKFNRHVREDIHRIVLEFVKDMSRNPNSIWRGEAGYELLLLINSVCSKETRGFLLEMVESRKFFAGDVPSLGEDLRLRVLQTLVSLGYRASYEFWLEQYKIAPERYAKIVFNGLSLIAPRQAIQFMSSLEDTETVEDIVSFSFPWLLDEYGVARIVPIIEEYLPKMKPGVRVAAQSFFADEGTTLKIGGELKMKRMLKMVMQAIVPVGIVIHRFATTGVNPISKWILALATGWIIINFVGEFIWPNKWPTK